jgi:hypothetical protein
VIRIHWLEIQAQQNVFLANSCSFDELVSSHPVARGLPSGD